MRIVILSLLLCISCKEDIRAPKVDEGRQLPIVSKPFDVEGDYHSLWPSSWSEIVMRAIEDQNSSLLRVDINESDLEKLNCRSYSNFSREDKIRFWTLFMSSISHFESNFNPNTRFWESSLGKYSEGLLQLSVDDSENHDFCDLNSITILNPKENLTCGVSILDKQIRGSGKREEGELFPKRYFYWSVLSREVLINKVTTFFKSKSSKILPKCN